MRTKADDYPIHQRPDPIACAGEIMPGIFSSGGMGVIFEAGFGFRLLSFLKDHAARCVTVTILILVTRRDLSLCAGKKWAYAVIL